MHGKPERQARPLEYGDLLRALPTGDRVQVDRDRALLLVGFAGGFRRSELAALDVHDLSFVEEGVLIILRRSKTDQMGEGRRVAIPYGPQETCPVRSLRQWMKRGQIDTGPVYRAVSKAGKVSTSRLSPQAINLIVKRCASQAGLETELISAHSLRAGLVTSAAKCGVSSWKIRAQTGHKSDAMVSRYVRDASLFNDNALGRVIAAAKERKGR